MPLQTHAAPNRTPGRRRANRNKNYASENDMPSEAPFLTDLGVPFTPQKSANNSPAPSTQTTQNQSRQRQRNGNRSRGKQGSDSPAPVKQGRSTPPQTSLPPKVVAEAVFAGATFHASPAPSSLPIPSFIMKTLDSPGLKGPGRASREPSPPATDSEAPTPQHRPLASDVNREESPLDFFFRADRAEKEEKERARRASSANVLMTSAPGPFSPPLFPPNSPPEARTLPSKLGPQANRRPPAPRPSTVQRSNSTGISVFELDGTPGKPMGPAFSTPYQDRIRAARGSNLNPRPAHQQLSPNQQAQPHQQSQHQPQHRPQQQPGQEHYADLTNKLKQYLAIGQGQEVSQQPQPISGPPPHQPLESMTAPQHRLPSGSVPLSNNTNQYNRHSAPPPTATAGPTPTQTGTPPKQDSDRSPDLLRMEDSLRRMLNIGTGVASAPPRSKY